MAVVLVYRVWRATVIRGAASLVIVFVGFMVFFLSLEEVNIQRFCKGSFGFGRHPRYKSCSLSRDYTISQMSVIAVALFEPRINVIMSSTDLTVASEDRNQASVGSLNHVSDWTESSSQTHPAANS